MTTHAKCSKAAEDEETLLTDGEMLNTKLSSLESRLQRLACQDEVCIVYH